MGPVNGWILAIGDRDVPAALWSLIPATLFSLGPLTLWIRKHKLRWLAVAVGVWVASGYLYAVAIWV